MIGVGNTRLTIVVSSSGLLKRILAHGDAHLVVVDQALIGHFWAVVEITGKIVTRMEKKNEMEKLQGSGRRSVLLYNRSVPGQVQEYTSGVMFALFHFPFFPPLPIFSDGGGR